MNSGHSSEHCTVGPAPLLLARVAKRQKMSPNLICWSQKCPQLYLMFDTKTFMNKTSFIRIFIGIKVLSGSCQFCNIDSFF